MHVTISDYCVTVRDLIDRMAELQADKVFLISPETGRTVTYGGLQRQALSLYGRFCQMGLQQGDKIALLLDNGLSTVQLFLGSMYGGFVSVPLNVRGGVAQLSYTLEHSDAKVVFVGTGYDGLIKEVTAQIQRLVEIIPVELDGWPEQVDGSSMVDLLPPIKAEHDAMLIYSSGTTGRPNGAVHTHRSVLAHGRNSARSHQLTAADRSLLVLPLYHINAECVTLMPTLTTGGSVVVPHGFVVSEFWNWLDDHRCTWSAVVPTIISQLLDYKDPKSESRVAAFQRIRFLRTSSAPLSPALHREFLDKFKLLLIQAMGSSEAGNVFSNPLPPGANKIGSPGLPWGFETKIVNRDGGEVPAGEPGEVLFRGDGMMQGYYKDPQGTAAALDTEGWLHTGDLAYRDADGYFFVVGRSKELIIKGGMNIAPKQIDEILEAHPAVLEAAAVGVPDRYVGEDLIAFAVLREGMSCAELELLSFCESHLGHFKTPTRIYFVQDLPKGPSGKVQRLRLVEEAERRSVARLAPSAADTQTTLTADSPVGLSATDSSLQEIIGAIWSDLLAQPRIDPQSNFFALGGQSLLGIHYISRLREKIPIILSLSDFFENPTIARQVALVRERLSSCRAQGAAGDDQRQTDLQPIPRRDRKSPCTLSLSQDRLWFLEQLLCGNPVYNEAEAVRLKGTLNLTALEQALNLVIDRHEILRSTIVVRDNQPELNVYDSWPVKIKQIDLSGLPTGQREARLAQLLVDEPRGIYRLSNEPGLRATLVQLAADEHAFILMMHHLVCDSASLGILWRELATLYEACLEGQPSPLPPLTIQYGDFAVWQRQPTRQVSVDEDLSFWREKLRDAPELLDLPSDRARPLINSYQGIKRRFSFGPALAESLRSLSRRERTSLFTVVAAALNVLLYRYTGKCDVSVAIPVADRGRPELRSLIGFLIDTLVLRTDLIGDPSFRELMIRVQRGVAEAYSHRAAPFDQVVNAVRPQRNQSYSPLAQVMLIWRDRDELPQFIGLAGLITEHLLAHTNTSKYDLTLTVSDAGDDIFLEFEYSTDLYDDSRVERMMGHLRMLLEGAAADCEQRISELPLLTTVERHQLLEEWNASWVDHPERDRCIHELFEAQAQRTPDAVALVFEESSLTYRDLDQRADKLAQQLRLLGVRSGVLAALFVDRSPDMVIGMLGVLKAGGAYVPLDPSHPSKRLAYMLADADPLILLTQQKLKSKLPTHCAHVVVIDADAAPEVQPDHEPHAEARSSPRDLAYVIYTSGSTGEPKGVEIEHRSVVNMLASMQRQPGLGAEDTMLAITTLAFDIAVLEIILPLVCGARLVIAPSRIVTDGAALANLTERHGVSIMQATPATWRLLVDAGWKGAPRLKVLCGGEAWTAELADQLLARCGSLWNMYGPTETTVWSAVADVESGGRVVIGAPITNTQFYILDRHLQPVPIGVPGELHIGGLGLARGYHNRTELTVEKFISDPFQTTPGARLYKTGDLARYLPDGGIEYLGRLDHQVKLRGFRIELGEIESILAEISGVGHAAVVIREDASGAKRLIAYLTRRGVEPPDESELRHQLREKLPEYMIPSVFVSLDRFPLSPSGKLDRQALPAPARQVEIDQRYVAPRTDLERVLCRIWCKWLKRSNVGIKDNFFDVGGYSMLTAAVVGEINKTLNTRLNMPTFFNNPTIELLAKVLGDTQHVESERQVVSWEIGSKGPPLYFIGAGLPEHRIARLIGADRTIFAVDIRMPTEWRNLKDRTALPTVEQLGKLYGDLVREHVGSSPCVIVGCYYFPGKIAFEVAHALRRAGVNIALVLLIEAPAWSGGVRRGPARQSWRWIWHTATERKDTPLLLRVSTFLCHCWRLFRWTLYLVQEVLRYRLFGSHFSSSKRGPSADLDTEGRFVERGLAADFRRIVGESFHPRPLDASGVLVRPDNPREILLPGYDGTYGWGELFTRGLKVIQARGNHVSMVSDENAESLAQQINEVLDQFNVGEEKSVALVS
jgi:amino acid adenylation domain-containing protein